MALYRANTIRFSTMTTQQQQQYVIFSRRAVGKLRRSQGETLSSSSSKKKVKADETPWPRSIQLAGYAALVLSVPFTVGAAIVEMPSFRRLVQGGDEDELYHQHDKENISSPSLGITVVQLVRDFWGEVEQQAEEELHAGNEAKTLKSFENEDPTHLRHTQHEVGRQIYSPQKLKVTYLKSPEETDMMDFTTYDSSVVKVVEDGTMSIGDGSSSTVRGEILSRLDSNWNADTTSSSISSSNEDVPLFAIDFLDDDNRDNSTDRHETVTIGDTFNTATTTTSSDSAQTLRLMTQAWSSWHYFPSSTSSASSSSETTKMSNDDIRKSELEWKKAELQRDLNDPNCLKDIDEMQHEVKAVEKELRRLNRKKWFLF